MGGSNCYLRDRRERKIVIKNGMEEYCSNFVLDKFGLDFRTVATSKPLLGNVLGDLMTTAYGL